MFENIESSIKKIKENYFHIFPIKYLIVIHVETEIENKKNLYKYFRKLTLDKKFVFRNKEKLFNLIRIDNNTYICKNNYDEEELIMFIKGIAGDINTIYPKTTLHFLITKPISII